MFTYRDFDGGTLGLAWTGDLKNAGGVCERNGVSLALSPFFREHRILRPKISDFFPRSRFVFHTKCA